MLDDTPPSNAISRSQATWLVAGLFVYCLALMVAIAWFRGIWFDEIWSVWASQHDLALPAAFHDRWLRDVHPPMFHAMNWLLQPVTGLGIFARRMENLGPLLAFVASAGILARRMPGALKFLAVFCVLTLSNRYLITYFGEHRPYFLQAYLFAIVVMAMYAISARRSDFDPAQDKVVAVILAASTVLALNAHYICTFVSGVALGVFLLDQLRQKHWRWAACIVGAGVIAAIPLLYFYWLEASYFKATTAGLWIDTGFRDAVVIIVKVVGFSAAANVVAAVVGLGALVSGLRGARAKDGGGEPAAEAIPWNFVWVMIIAIAVAIVLMLVINAIQPVILERYFIPLAPMVEATLAALAARALWSRRALFAAFVVNAALAATLWAYPEIRHAQWSETARRVQAQVRSCPTTLVYGLDPTFASPYHGSPGQPAVHDWGYQLVGGYFGFPVRGVVHPQDRTPPQLAQTCPTVFWAEHMLSFHMKEVKASPFAHTLPGAGLDGAKVYDGQTGFILTVPPTATTAAGAAVTPPAAGLSR